MATRAKKTSAPKTAKQSAANSTVKKPQAKKTIVSQSAQDGLMDGRHTLSQIKEHRAQIAKKDEKKRRKLVDDAMVKRWDGDIVIAQEASGGQRVLITVSVEATAEEISARDGLFDLLVELKGDLELRIADQPKVAAAYGFANPITRKSTSSLLDGAETVISSFAAGKYRSVLADAGVNAERIDEISTARTRLATADASQRAARATTKGHTVTKKEALNRVKKNSVLMRKILRFVFKGQPAMLAKFKNVAPRHTPKSRVVDQSTQTPVDSTVEMPAQDTEKTVQRPANSSLQLMAPVGSTAAGNGSDRSDPTAQKPAKAANGNAQAPAVKKDKPVTPRTRRQTRFRAKSKESGKSGKSVRRARQ